MVARTVVLADADDVASARYAVRTGRIVTAVERSPVADESAFVAEPVTRMATAAVEVADASDGVACPVRAAEAVAETVASPVEALVAARLPT